MAWDLLRAMRPGLTSDELRAAASVPGEPAIAPAPLGLASPWSQPNHLASVVWRDIFGDTALRPVTRAEAMSVPAAARARHVLCTTIAARELVAYRGDQRIAPPSWATSTAGALSPFHRMVWTVDDLLWFGWSCWRRTSNSATDGRPLQMDRLPMGRWSFDTHGNVLWDRLDGAGQRPALPGELVLIPGFHEGLLTFAQDTLRHAADLQRAAGRAARHPSAYLALKQTGGTPLSRDERRELIAEWAAAREGENGGVAFLNETLDARELGTFDRHLVLDGRNAAAVDVARAASLPADLVDAAGQTSLTYSNARDNDRRGVDYGSGGYMGAISARLSQDDVAPAGQRLAFDLEELAAATAPGEARAGDQTRPADTAAGPTPPPAVVRPIRAVEAQ